MWASRCEPLADMAGRRVFIEREGRPASCAEVLRGWQDDAGLRTLFSAVLAEAPYLALRWEMPAVTTATLAHGFECVLLDSPWLQRSADHAAFADHFVGACARGVVSFANLGADALLIVPCPPPRTPLSTPRSTLAAEADYAHLAAFLRTAPAWQQHALWQAVAQALASRLGARPLWLSTAGAAVPWLHVRLDERPKYYGYAPYAAIPRGT